MKQKFKVWDKKNNQFDDSNYIYADMDGDIYLIEERNWAMSSYMHREEVSDRYELVWYTGLKDKNGVEIYESDLVSGGTLQCNDGYSIRNTTTTVRFENGMFLAGGLSLVSIHKRCELIGSIYTHPHLLGSEKE